MLKAGIEAEFDLFARVDLDVGADEFRVVVGGGGEVGEGAREDLHESTGEFDGGDFFEGLEIGVDMAGLVGEGDPELDAIEDAGIDLGSLFGMRDAFSRGHDVEAAGASDGFTAEAVIVQDLSFHQPGDGLEAGVGVGSDVHGFFIAKGLGAEAVQEAPGADHAALFDGERAGDLEGSEGDFSIGVGLQDVSGGPEGHALFRADGNLAHRGSLTQGLGDFFDPGDAGFGFSDRAEHGEFAEAITARLVGGGYLLAILEEGLEVGARFIEECLDLRRGEEFEEVDAGAENIEVG